jgi:hypothetical protein
MLVTDFFAAFGPPREATRSKSGETGATRCYTVEITGEIPVAPVKSLGETGATNVGCEHNCCTCSTDDMGRCNRNTSTISTLYHHVAPVSPEKERLASCTAPDDDAEERAAILEYDAHLPRHEAERLAGVPPADDGPVVPCPCCGWRVFWRPSMTRELRPR